MNSKLPLPRLSDFWGKSSSILPIGTQYIRGRRYQVCAIDADIYTFLSKLAYCLRQGDFHPGRLLPLRADFRQIFQRNSLPVGLVFSLNSDDYLQRRLAAWLLGRSTWPRGASQLRNCSLRAPAALQFEAARAMKRLRAWSELRQFELRIHHYHDKKKNTPEFHWPEAIAESPLWLDRLRTICEQHAARNYAMRLSTFLSSGVSCPASTNANEQRQPLWYQEPLGPGQQPKSRWFIRKILERIRLAVRR